MARTTPKAIKGDRKRILLFFKLKIEDAGLVARKKIERAKDEDESEGRSVI
jgi:hypothetical protein